MNYTANTSAPIVEQCDRYVLQLDGATVDRCYVDHAFGLVILVAGQAVEVRIEGEFQLFRGSVELRLSASRARELGVALELFAQAIGEIVARKDGCLEVDFMDGSRISVAPDTDFEAWQVAGPGGLLLVGLPGGGVSIWTPPG